MRFALASGALWAVGNALTSGAIVYYLARDLGATGLMISLILAAPSLIGVLRLAAPAAIRRFGSPKPACLALLAVSYTLMIGLPAIALAPRGWGLPMLIALLCAHQLLDFIGTVALWSWLAEIVPEQIRGRYFGRRQMWQLIAVLPTLLAAGWFADWWKWRFAQAPASFQLLGYAIPNAIGALCLLASLVPLAMIRAGTKPMRVGKQNCKEPLSIRAVLAPFADSQFRRLLAFRTMFAIANGLTQTVQAIFPKDVLRLGLGEAAIMKNGMQVGQMGYSRFAGAMSDRHGNRPVLALSQILVSIALLFYIFAAPQPAAMRWLLLGAWLLWSAYAGHNICLPNLALKLAPAESRAAFVAAHEAVGSLPHGMATVLGGFVFDWLCAIGQSPSCLLGSWQFDRFRLLLTVGLVLRLSCTAFATRVAEPGASRWRDILAGWMWKERKTSKLALPALTGRQPLRKAKIGSAAPAP